MDSRTLALVRDRLRQGHVASAEELFQTVVADQDADDADVLACRGLFELVRGRVEAAGAFFRRSFDIAPTLDASLNLCAIAASAGEMPTALVAMAAALRLAPESPSVLGRQRALFPPERIPRPTAGTDTLDIWFCQPRSLPCDASTPRTSPLGGTESAALYLADALARRGHHVRVYNNCPAPGDFDGVAYRRWEDARADAVLDPPHVLVAIRDWALIGSNRYAPLQVFWTGDAADQPFARGLEQPEARRAIDLFVFQSAWQEAGFRALGVPPWRCLRERYGFAPFVHPAPSLRPRRLVYASTPFRGLDLLLDWFPLIRARCPDAELRVCSSMRVYAVPEEEDRARFGALYARARQPGVTFLGSLPQPALAAELSAARVLAYPNHWPETCCVAAIEALAAGCPVLTSSLGALPETVGEGGICLSGDPRSDSFRDRFVDEAVALLTDDERWSGLSALASRRAHGRYRYEAIAEGWEQLCARALSGESPILERVAAHMAAGRASLVDRLLEKEPRPASVPAETWESLRQLARWLTRPAGFQPPDFRVLAAAVGPLRRLSAFDRWAAQVQVARADS
jgi:glycosyltransferase involved in cell wall biosynthesis